MQSDILTPEQVATYLQLNKDTVYRLIREKRLAAMRIGRTYRIPRADLEAFMTANSTRGEVRQIPFRRVLEIAQRTHDLDGDRLLEQLESDNGLLHSARKA